MDKNAFDWTRAHAFVVSADAGSFSAASRRLGLSQPTVSRQVAALEKQLGVELFERLGRNLKLTTAGERLLGPAKAMEMAAHELSLAATAQDQTLAGRVTLTASDLIAGVLLPELLTSLSLAHPHIQLELVTTAATSALLMREADIAVRHFQPTEPDLITRRIREFPAYMYASADYLRRAGPIRSLADLQDHRFIGFTSGTLMIDSLKPLGLVLTEANFPFVATNSLMHIALAQQGAGICFAMEPAAARLPGLEPILPEQLQLPVPVWIVCHRELRTTPRFRVVFDALAEYFSALL